MKRINEKIKDLIEARPYKSLSSYLAEPSQTLAAYVFTDATSDLMAKWIDKVADVQPHNGYAYALAGNRGVGKSHFLATFGAIVANPELRSRVSDSHVLSSAQTLKRRRHPVAFVMRGTRETLLEELRDGLAKAFECDPSHLQGSPSELLAFASQQAGDLPFVIVIDTSSERIHRVNRDDGVLLGELAQIAKPLNIFVCAALDDDITGADGVNAAISQNYSIFYLDQEHLHLIADNFLFPKKRQTRALMHEVYEYLRESMPRFSYSEQKFSKLYPLHPIVLDVAPFIRLYSPSFALLGFAADACAKALNRPAHSLIALDELFDRTESELRKAEDLKEVFVIYDKLATEVIGQLPVMQRLQAKMILKGLLLLSLDGDGTTAQEISTAMLILDEKGSTQATDSVQGMLETFVSMFPEDVRRKAEDGREIRYGLKISTKDSLNDTLSELAKKYDATNVEKVLRRIARERFDDWTFQADDEAINADVCDSQIVWRGCTRRGRLVWNYGKPDTEISLETPDNFLDWEIIISDSDGVLQELPKSTAPIAIWKPAKLKPEEIENILRYAALLNDTSLAETYGEQIPSIGRTYASLVKKIWTRVFLEDGRLFFDDAEYVFGEAARNAATLSEAFSLQLTPLFESRYPGHPVFSRNLGINEVSRLVSDLFSGKKQPSSESEKLAEVFAVPLGLTVQRGNHFVLESDDKISRLPWSTDLLAMIADTNGDVIPLKTIYQQMRREPYGLAKEAQHLVLAALVAQRRIEFVTSKGDRIGRRSLDLTIIWDDIVGVARPSSLLHGSAELTNWARILTGLSDFRSIDIPEDREVLRTALQDWLLKWQKSNVLERFEKLPRNIINTKVWRLSERTHKTFGAVASAVESTIEDSISLEEALQRVADAFADSPSEFFGCTSDLVALSDFIDKVSFRETIWRYFSISEKTDDDDLEKLRDRLSVFLDVSGNPSNCKIQEFQSVWNDFHDSFSASYIRSHDQIMKSHDLQEKIGQILQSDEWWEFENLARIPAFQESYWEKAKKLREKSKALNCRFDVRHILETQPFCSCEFRLSNATEWMNLPRQLFESMKLGRENFRQTLRMLSGVLVPIIEEYSRTESDSEMLDRANTLMSILSKGDPIPLLKNSDLQILEIAFNGISNPPVLRVALPTGFNAIPRDELRRLLNKWLDNLPGEPTLVKA